MRELVIHKRALRYVRRLSQTDRRRIHDALTRLAEDPVDAPGVVQMAGEWGGYRRIRIGSLRVIFWYDEKADTVYVDHIGPRGDIYR